MGLGRGRSRRIRRKVANFKMTIALKQLNKINVHLTGQ